jgi:hypothetical protein
MVASLITESDRSGYLISCRLTNMRFIQRKLEFEKRMPTVCLSMRKLNLGQNING